MEREPRADKVAVVEDVKSRFEDADAVLVTEYRGLDVGQLAELRGALRASGTEYKIYKNTLVRRAVAETEVEGLEDLLSGPTALAFVATDPSAAAKALKDFAATNDDLIIKGGVLSGGLLDEAQVRELAELPSRDELLSSLAGGLAAPLQQMASMMNNLLGEVTGLLQALADKGGAPGAPADAPSEDEAAEAPSADTASEDTESDDTESDDTESEDTESEDSASDAPAASEEASSDEPADEPAAESSDED